MKISLSFISISILILALSCTEVKQKDFSISPTQPNPNGDSELALLMREMFDDGMRMKNLIENGKHPEVIKIFEKIHTAQATEPEKAASKKYKLYGDAYLNALQNLKNSTKDDVNDLFHGVVQSCMNCHKAMCPGPVVRIKKLYLEKKN